MTFVGTSDTDDVLYGLGRHGLDAQVPLTSLSLTVGATTASLDGSIGIGFNGEQGILTIDQIAGPTYAEVGNHPHTGDYSILFTTFSNSTDVDLFGEDAGIEAIHNATFSTDLGPAMLTVPSFPFNQEGTFTTTLGATPEPSSVGLLATGLLGIAGLLKGRQGGQLERD